MNTWKKTILLSSIILSFTFLTIILESQLNYAQNDQNDEKIDENSLQYFGCRLYQNEVHCDPLTNYVEGYFFNGISKNIYAPRSYGTQEEYGAPIVSMAYSPDGRIFFTEKDTGHIRILDNEKVIPEPFVKISNLHTHYEQGMLGITLDPNFEQNHFLYLYHTYNESGTIYNRIVRFTDFDNKGMDMKIILDKIPAGTRGEHSGGALAFGPDEKLYVVVGDRSQADTAQDLSELTGKTLRLNKDGSVPADNPFPNSFVYTYGHRNMFGIAFDNDGTGYITENGLQYYDEVNKLVKGGNYGWPILQPANLPPENSIDSIKPERSYWQVIAPTQAIYYDKSKFDELQNTFLFGTYISQTGDVEGWSSDLIALQFNKQGHVEEKVISTNHIGPVISITQSPEGDIYFGGWHIYKIVSIDLSSKKQILFPIEIEHAFNVKQIKFDPSEKKLMIDILNFDEFPGNVKVKFSKNFMDKIDKITSNEKELEFSIIEDSDEFNILDISLPSGIESNLTITSNKVLTQPQKDEFPQELLVIVSGIIIAIIVTIIIIQKIIVSKKSHTRETKTN